MAHQGLARHSQASLAAAHVGRIIHRWQPLCLPGEGHERATSEALAVLATLRHAPVGDPSSDVRVWQVTLDGIPEELLSDRAGAGTTRGERAIHAALVLWAKHQQSKRTPMHVAGRSLGLATRDLSRAIQPGDELSPPVLRRFHSVATATGEQQQLHHLRSLVSLFRAHDVPLDYARLAADLFLLDTTKPNDVRLSWGRDLHRRKRQDSEDADLTPPPQNAR